MDITPEKALVNQPKTVRGQETLNRICQAAEQVFYEKGYYETSINDITNLAKVSAGTFYIYFESKLMLYKYLLSQYGHRIRKHISLAVANCTTRRSAERERVYCLRSGIYTLQCRRQRRLISGCACAA